ncbi:MAG: M28 family peptidase [Deltaproteobacteria bacterium]|nr:M28 family peptidase [Deltaproteobacteria bacterium]
MSIGGFFLLFLSSSCRPADPTTPQSEQTAESPCDPSSVETLIPCVSTARWSRDLAVLAAGPRPPGSKHWQIAQDLCASRFAELGYTVERHQYDTGVNVIGILPGTSADQVVLSAHYDGVEACPAADDNASGVAGVLEAARVLAAGRYAGTLVVACWDDEENGLVGSRAWTARASDRDEPILASFVFEMIGYRTDQPDTQRLPPGVDLVFPAQVEWLRQRQNRGDFIAVVADTGSYWAVNRLETRAAELGLPTLVVEIPTLLLATPLAEPLFRSDHASFWEHGYPGILITDTADYRYARYHCAAAPDSPDALDPEFATLVVRSTVAAIVDTLGLSVPPSS